MRITISLPDALFQAAERVARRRGMSRRQLYAQALERLIDEEAGDDATARLDAIYATEESRIDADVAAAQRRAVDETP